jgi:acetylornithine deacetylase/succinyl-diaminopimelate desuccinylase-like protein
MGMGGSIPFIAEFAAAFPDAKILVTGVEDPGTQAHSINESLHLGVLERAATSEALFLQALGSAGWGHPPLAGESGASGGSEPSDR